MTEDQLDSRMLKLARMVEQGVPNGQIAAIIGLTEDSLANVFKTDEFRHAEAFVAEEAFTMRQQLSAGWDGVEEFALSTVLGHLQSPAPDPDYALKAAAIANKAVRHGKKNGNHPIEAAGNLQSVITLNATYVNKVQNNFQVSERVLEEMPKKQTDMLSVNGVKSLLGMTKELSHEAVSVKQVADDIDAAIWDDVDV